MAIMWPRKLPPEVLRSELRSAERKVYDHMAAELDDSWVVFYSRPWLGLTSSGEEIDGECDFLVARADSGLLALEVKGGAIRHDPATTTWTSRDRWGITHRIKDPVHQARSSKYQLLKKLKATASLHHRRLRAHHGVIFPDVEAFTSALRPDIPAELFCTRPQFESGLARWLEQRLGVIDSGSGETPLGADGLAALENLLAKPFQLDVSLGHLVREDENAMKLLTPGQYRILTLLESIPRAAIGGGAGTGKTLLAMEKARRCARAGLRTLMTCFNEPLAHHAATLLAGISEISVMTFQACCRRSAVAAGLPVPDGLADDDTLRNRFPELLITAMHRRPSLGYDAVMVDEGQDFPSHWWPAVDSLMPTGKGLLYVFHDANQRVYPDTLSLPGSLQSIPVLLDENLRNTRRIHEVCRPHYTGRETHPVGPEGVPVHRIEATDRELFKVLDQLIKKCIQKDGIPAVDLGVIVSSRSMIQRLSPGGRIGGCPTVLCGNQIQGAVTMDTARRFKGLECAVILLVADDLLVRDRELMYVALSRARSYLIVVGTERNLAVLAAPP